TKKKFLKSPFQPDAQSAEPPDGRLRTHATQPPADRRPPTTFNRTVLSAVSAPCPAAPGAALASRHRPRGRRSPIVDPRTPSCRHGRPDHF
ncbi:hypothetical protein AB0I10_40880, partial [Streptomyces sp. NPDC050636]|uniref:hypothetical protein n=1 Tax=Streptomyces sp. NPDC050636 TaxID=3154510 RepID=UPI00341CE8B9